MKGSVNLEFGDEDLRRFAEDVLRRGALHTIGELFNRVVNDPRLSQLFKDTFWSGIEMEREGRSFMYPDVPMPPGMRRRRRQVPFQYPNDMPFGGAPPPGSPGDPGPSPYPPAGPSPAPPQGAKTRCMRVEANPYQEEGWICHECQTYNGVHRAECRQCAHERCDDIVGVPSGSA